MLFAILVHLLTHIQDALVIFFLLCTLYIYNLYNGNFILLKLYYSQNILYFVPNYINIAHNASVQLYWKIDIASFRFN